MSKLRHSISSARGSYESQHYRGSLADELGLRKPRHHGRRLWRWAAIAALIGVSVYLLRFGDSSTAPAPTTPQQAEAPNAPGVLPAVATTPDDVVEVDDSSLAEADDTSDTETESLQFSAPSTAISFSNITGLPSVSASIPALGSLPSLESAGSTPSTSTTQESAS